MKFKLSLIVFTMLLTACKDTTTLPNFIAQTAEDTNLWLDYSPEATTFKLWSPTAQAVRLNLYTNGTDGTPFETHMLNSSEQQVWYLTIAKELAGVYYTYQIQVDNQWLDETPGIYAQAVGVNGKRAMVLDLQTTNPEGWNTDQGPKVTVPNEAIIYEMHIRDLTIQPQSGSSLPGTYLGLVEEGTKGPNNVTTGIDHIKELGVTHVHLLPTYDHYSINETQLDKAQFNWGYDPQNYNVPEGSFSTNPFDAEVRIKEFKTMVQRFHNNGIGVILDVVYNHTGGQYEHSNFNLEAPDYYYRFDKKGNLSNASACGNETASEKAMMRKYMMASVLYWAEEYHLDGFRFDLMGIHDIETMNALADALKSYNPNLIIYGEGWTAGDSPLPPKDRALKQHIHQMPNVAAFSDDIRDGLKGSVFDDASTGFVSGAKNTEASIQFGVVGAIQHPQLDYQAVNYSKAPWTNAPWQAISYVSCHDNHTLYDKLKLSCKEATETQLIAMDKLANAIVLTSQGTAFIHAGSEMLRTKQGEHNSYNLPDSINQINWNWKHQNQNVVSYYQNLIALRKAHPAFRMPTSAMVSEHLTFKTVSHGIVSYELNNHANGDAWNDILVIYNAQSKPYNYKLDAEWQLAVIGDNFTLENGEKISASVKVPPLSLLVAYKN